MPRSGRVASARSTVAPEPLGRRRVHRVAGPDVAAVDVDLYQQLGQGRGEPDGVDVCRAGVGARSGGHPGQPAQLGLQQPGHHLALGAELDVGQLAAAVGIGPYPLQRLVGGGHQRLLDGAQRVVAGRARARPRVGQGLVALEDLLHHHPGGSPGRRGRGDVAQPLEVALGVGEAVGMIDAEAVDDAPAVEVDQQRVGGVEHVGQLDPYGNQRVDVEEAPVGQHLVLVAPRREQVVLAGEDLTHRAVRRAGRQRERVVVVAEHLLVSVAAAVGAQLQLAGVEHGVEGVAQQRQRELPAGVVPVDVEPVRRGRLPPEPERLPQRRVEVLGCRQRHVVGHHVDHDAEAVRHGLRRRAARAPGRHPARRTPGSGRRRRSRAASRAPPAAPGTGRGARRRDRRGTAPAHEPGRSRSRRAAAAGRCRSAPVPAARGAGWSLDTVSLGGARRSSGSSRCASCRQERPEARHRGRARRRPCRAPAPMSCRTVRRAG